MAKIKLIHGDAADFSVSADIMLTDPPFDLCGAKLHNIVDNYECNHLLLMTTMQQLIEFISCGGWIMSFDFVLDIVAPKKSMNFRQPNYTHVTCAYFYKKGVKSIFNRKIRQRSDVFEGNGYWPTIFYAPRERSQQFSFAKNVAAITDILGSFDVQSVVDPFAGSGTTAMAAWELGINCTLIESNVDHVNSMQKTLKFMGLRQ